MMEIKLYSIQERGPSMARFLKPEDDLSQKGEIKMGRALRNHRSLRPCDLLIKAPDIMADSQCLLVFEGPVSRLEKDRD
jgi:hypothetical protein